MTPAEKIAFWQQAFCAALQGLATNPEMLNAYIIEGAEDLADKAVVAADNAHTRILMDAGIYE
jgi:hypothetical protein